MKVCFRGVVWRLCGLGLVLVWCIAFINFSPSIWAKDFDFKVLFSEAPSSGDSGFNFASQTPYTATCEALDDVVLETRDSSVLHMKLDLISCDMDLNDLQQRLLEISSSYDRVVLTIVPGALVLAEDYRAFCLDLGVRLQSLGLANVECVVFPIKGDDLGLYTDQSLSNLGVVIEGTTDLEYLERVYAFSLKHGKRVFVEDRMPSFYKQDVKSGVKALYEVYFTLGVKYPEIDTIFIDDVFLSDLSADASKQVSYTKQYQRTYSNVIMKVSTDFKTLSTYTLLDAENCFFIWGRPDLFKNTAYVEYKWNDYHTEQVTHFPYPLTTDSKLLHNGINRLKIVGFDASNQVLWRKSVDVKVHNNLIAKRSSRVNSKYPTTSKPSYKGRYIPVLMYHYFSEGKSSASESNYLSVDVFEEQIKALLKNGYTPISFYDLKQFMDGKADLPSKPILITADDGYLNNYTLAYPILKKYNVQATFFVSTAFVGEKTVNDHFSWEDALKMEKSGLIDIQIHGHDHTRFTSLSTQDISYQVSMALGLIEKYLGKRDVRAVAYPEFKHSTQTVSLLSKMDIDFQITNLAKRGTVL